MQIGIPISRIQYSKRARIDRRQCDHHRRNNVRRACRRPMPNGVRFDWCGCVVDRMPRRMLHGRRIHGELLKLGIEIGPNLDRQVYGKHRRPPSQGWRTFLRNHAGRAHSGLARLMSRIRRRISSGTFGLHHRHRPTNAAVAQRVVPHHLEYRRNSHEIKDL